MDNPSKDYVLEIVFLGIFIVIPSLIAIVYIAELWAKLERAKLKASEPHA